MASNASSKMTSSSSGFTSGDIDTGDRVDDSLGEVIAIVVIAIVRPA